MKLLITTCLIALLSCSVMSGQKGNSTTIVTGAEQTQQYVPLLKGKRVAILANQTTIIGRQHLVDSLLKLQVNIVKIFGPEHGFRGNASNGAKVKDEQDAKTGLKLLSLYGAKRKPTKEDLADVDIVIFDIQDVGCRFYTYINVLRDVMEACAENGKPMLVLDRPNPNGYLVDGPILDMSLKSGIGQFPIPIAHGMTIGEFANMINGEGWLPNQLHCDVKVIALKNYRHEMSYTLPVPPSPNLNTQQSIMLYPSICLFEGTIVSQGRGTDSSFTILGSPALKGKYAFHFTPRSLPGKSETPLHMNETCYGLNLYQFDVTPLVRSGKINIQWMMELYKAYPEKERFFDRSQSKQINDIDKLAGTKMFRQQIIDGASENDIRASWEPGLTTYKTMRKKYLLYP
ncbi:exo-beta-N-acetylmuramidase NamZ family protein [Flavihumibacter petaseus]|uniref:DUF1343 domain-containing protein n=1 Tax=Flavihumibacter petaseus NBRC 106054 TaxID=1220578 RepID=A0A0E9MYN2_9BACT|nr:DUF1343 domain-containing protein [Flavihumibacter petaseus]GAO42618.1 hypothetical protein FPE01S_01_16330 [Flavihumibacter petaseus NBRC 106054]